MQSRDATELPPGHETGSEAEDEYAPVLPWAVRNELTELAKRDD